LETFQLKHELPYQKDSAELFECLLEMLWPVFLDSGYPHSNQGRYDILAADPYKTLITKGRITETWDGVKTDRSPDDPFTLLKHELGTQPPSNDSLPFCGGAIGYFGYDLGRRLENLPNIAEDSENIPDMIFGLYDWAIIVDHQSCKSWLVGQGRDSRTEERWSDLIHKFSQHPTACTDLHTFRVCGKVESNMTAEQYAQSFRRIKQYLVDGDCYQVNLAQRFTADCQGHPWLAYKTLRRINAAPFCSYLDFSTVQVLSSSPERFIDIHNGFVETKPIKGTLPRLSDYAADQQQTIALKNSKKDQAENLMIVDLLRNDIGKSCTLGSVTVPRLFDIESFATVHHMVSTIQAQLSPECHSLDLLRGCFPGGSITGAPKIRAMEIIEELEPHRRGLYCGSIGYIGFDGSMDTNIAIRTLVHSDKKIRFWAGGGIVADSRENAEYQESLDKAAAMLELLSLMQKTC